MIQFTSIRRYLLATACAGATLSVPAQPADTANSTVPLHHGAVGVGTWNTTAEFKDIVVTSNGVVLYRSDFAKDGTNGLSIFAGTWSVKDGVLRQSAIAQQCRVYVGDKNWGNYTINLRARSTGGQEGFAVYFHAQDANQWTWFNVGGWTNTLSSIDQHVSTRWNNIAERVPTTVETNVWYDVQVVLNQGNIQCYVNSKLVQATNYPDMAPAAAIVASTNIIPATPVAPANVATNSNARKADAGRFQFNPVFHGAIGVGAWDTVCEFRNIVVTSNKVVLYQSDFEKEGIESWNTTGGEWVIADGVLRQTKSEFNCFATTGDPNWCNYTMTLQVRKVSGDEGFIIAVGCLEPGNLVWFNAGSWGNHSAEIYQDVQSRRGTITPMLPFTVEPGKWYDVRVEMEGARVSCYLNSNLVQTGIAQVLVTTNAVYLGSLPVSDGHVLRFKIGKQELRAKLTKDRGGPPALEIGSLVQVTGTVQPGLESADADSEFQLFSPADIVLLERPSWWTWERTLLFGGISLSVLATAAIWIAMISRRNRLLTMAQSELKRANDELELRVQARTADLAKSNAELQSEQALLRNLMDNASDFIYFKDRQSRFVRFSNSLCKLAGLTREQLVGKTDFDCYKEEDARRAFEDEQEIIRTGNPLVGKLETEVHSDGRVTWVMTTKMPWRNTDGEILGTFGISCDITSVKQAEAELSRAQKQLLETSRAAGMAEVATGVLHNVGNVLNSVNISTSLLAEQLRNSKSNLVDRVASMMNEHKADLANFLTNDPQGKRLQEFLEDVGKRLSNERSVALTEIANLRKNVDHIKEIVAMQQNYATVRGVNTIVKLHDLLEDVLQLTETGLVRHRVELVKEFDQNLPEINIDHHKVVQILVNLIRNAKNACEESSQVDKRVVLHVASANGMIRISVIDNGVGIATENLTRIFGHGFTTRKDGHGYGLHSSALAAKEIGGRLTVQSDGPGQGAVFTLELKMPPQSVAPRPRDSQMDRTPSLSSAA